MERQTLWRQRLDAYTQLLRTTTEFLDRCHAMRNRISAEPGDPQEIRSQSIELQKIRTETFKAVTVVEIFGDAAILEVLRQFFLEMRETRTGGTSTDTLSNEIAALGHLQTTFVAAARSQLKSALDQD